MIENIRDFENRLKVKSKSRGDLFLCLIISALMFALFMKIDFFEIVVDITREYEEYDLDEYIMLYGVISLCALWYSYRRYKEISILKIELEVISKNLEKALGEEIKKSNQILLESNKKLDTEIKEAILKVKEQDIILSKKDKLEAMGEMLDSISHQWRQPLNSISICASGLKLSKELGQLNDKAFESNLNSIVFSCNYLSNTIDDFRNFLKKDKLKHNFSLKQILKSSERLLKTRIDKEKVVIFVKNDDILINGFKNELLQVFINILNNSIDELSKKNQKKKRIIIIEFSKSEDKIHISFKDNAQGIDPKILPFIFDQNVSSKNTGSGIGLYMSRKIITESYKGELKAKNIEYEHENECQKGAEFSIVIPIF